MEKMQRRGGEKDFLRRLRLHRRRDGPQQRPRLLGYDDPRHGLPKYHRGDHPQSADQSCVGGLLAAAAEWGD